jgi:subtilisin-like proprotein convertase family protein
MNKTKLLVLLVGTGTLSVGAAVFETYPHLGLNQSIPDGNASGVALTYTVGSAITSIESVRVSLDISSDSNGSLYVYLSHGNSIAILLNRPGKTSSNPVGDDDSGFDVTLDDSQVNRDIHVYNTIQAPPAGQPLTGLWHSDARDIDPDHVLDTSPQNAGLAVFNSKDANGTWTLFVASLESGGSTTLKGWNLEVMGVPEPMPFGRIAVLLLLSFAAFRKLRD